MYIDVAPRDRRVRILRNNVCLSNANIFSRPLCCLVPIQKFRKNTTANVTKTNPCSSLFNRDLFTIFSTISNGKIARQLPIESLSSLSVPFSLSLSLRSVPSANAIIYAIILFR